MDSEGNIKTLYAENNLPISADLFIDCSGFKSQILSNILQEKFISFNHRLFCDSAVVGNWMREYPIFPFTTVTTMPSGWCWRIDLRNRVSFGYVYSSQFCDQDQALLDLIKFTPKQTKNFRHLTFKSGRYQRFWVNNVVAIGNASGFVEPLESTGQHMIAETLWRLILTLQDSNLCPSAKLKEATNQYIASQWDEICDFLTLHFKFNYKLNTPFWRYCHQETTLGAIANLVELYQDSGISRIMSHFIPQSSIFEIDGYLSLLCGQKIAVNNRLSLNQQDKREWDIYRQNLRQQLQQSFTPQQAFVILNNHIFKS